VYLILYFVNQIDSNHNPIFFLGVQVDKMKKTKKKTQTQIKAPIRAASGSAFGNCSKCGKSVHILLLSGHEQECSAVISSFEKKRELNLQEKNKYRH